jgi:NAD(P)-dependent dehydrogenase (short-subunit alcohol dehydrogenase family)
MTDAAAILRLDGKVAVVTGAASGIGAAVARLLTGLGAEVVGFDVASADGVSACDVSDEASVEAAFAEVNDQHGRLDLAVNAAAINSASMPTHERTLADWQRLIDVDLTGVFLCVRAELRAMLASGGGSIVNIASSAGLGGTATLSHYSAAKSGVVGLTKSAALEYATQNIRVNAVCPGPTRTPMLRAWAGSDAAVEQHGLTTPMQRLGEPTEVAVAVAWLLSDEAGYVTGVALPHDGGRFARS